jgi:hypothetical protein
MSCQWIRFRRSASTLSRNVGDEVLVTRPYSDGIASLPDSAGVIWRRLASPVTLPQLVQDLSQVYAVEAIEIEDDVKTLLDGLLHRHLIEELVTADE